VLRYVRPPCTDYEFAHFDADDNILCPILGRKRVRMWAPQDFARMYPNRLGSKGRTVQFEVRGDKPDFRRHPMAKGLRCWDVTVHPGQILFIPAFTIHQVTSLDAAVSLNVFFGDAGENNFVTKLCGWPRIGAFSYWLNNIVDQNRSAESWERILAFLPRSLKGFLRNQFREEATEEQIQQLCAIIYTHLGVDQSKLVPPPDFLTRRNPPLLKIRGLLFRDVDSDGNDHDRHSKKNRSVPRSADASRVPFTTASEGTAHGKRAKLVTTPLTTEQQQRLRESFDANPRPNMRAQEQLALSIGCTAFQINQCMRTFRGERYRRQQQKQPQPPQTAAASPAAAPVRSTATS
jgi:hypothetical protein